MEIWKPVVGWEGLYEVSSNGRIKSIARKGNTLLGERLYGGKIISPIIRKDGYRVVNLTNSNSRKQRFLHNIILETFVGERPNGHHGCHNDGDKRNNAIENLRWDTVVSNMSDKKKHGTWQGGENGSKAKLTELQAIEIKYSKIPISYFAKKYNMSISGVYKIRRGESWKHI